MKFIENMSLRGKLLTISFVSLAIILVLGINSYVGLSRLEAEVKNITEISVPNNAAIASMDASFRSLRIELRTLGLPGITEEQKNVTYANIQKYIAEFEKSEKAFVALGFIGEEKADYEMLRKEMEGFKALGGKILELSKSTKSEDKEALLKIFLYECPQYAERVDKIIVKISDFYYQKTNEYIAKNANVTSITSNLNSVLVVVGITVGMGVSWAFVTLLVRRFNDINTALVDSAEIVKLATTKISDSSVSLNSTTAEQNSAVLQVTATTEELKAMTERNLASVTSTEGVTKESFEMVKNGQKTFEKMFQSVREIEKANENSKAIMDKSNTDIEKILVAIQDIGTKTQVINEIVFQTKLLSFNASVEAARAGEHGRGFAIVAEEIGNLANMSGRASEDIAKMLKESSEEIQHITTEMRNGMSQSIANSSARVNDGMVVTRECGDIFNEILSNMGKINQLTNEISMASKEQYTGVAEVDKAILNIDQGASLTSQISEESSKLSNDLHHSVSSLHQSIEDLKRIVHGKHEPKVA